MYEPPLREKGRNDLHPKEAIDESIRGVEFDFYYTGKRLGSGNLIELHITSIVRDWEENIYIRRSWYSGSKKCWKNCIEDHVRQHLQDLSTGAMLIMSLMRDFEVKQEHYKEWNQYKPVSTNLY